jgi:hypothetical protein
VAAAFFDSVFGYYYGKTVAIGCAKNAFRALFQVNVKAKCERKREKVGWIPAFNQSNFYSRLCVLRLLCCLLLINLALFQEKIRGRNYLKAFFFM